MLAVAVAVAMIYPRTLLGLTLSSSVAAALPANIARVTRNGFTHGITNDTAAIANQTFDYVIAGMYLDIIYLYVYLIYIYILIIIQRSTGREESSKKGSG